MPEHKHRRRADAAMLVALLLSIVLFWHWRIATATTKYTAASWDVFLYFAPMYDYIGAALRAGRVPLWNPYQGCGEPLLGVLQGGVLYPARALLLFLDAPRAMAWSAALHIGLALGATFLYLRSMGASPWAAATAGVTFAYGFAASAIYQPASFFEPGVWLPLAAFAIHRLVCTGKWRYVALASAAIAAPILAGGYQIALYSAYGIVAIVVGLWLDPATASRARTLRALALLGLCGLLAVALSAPQWATTVLWARETLRPAATLESARVDPFHLPPLVVLENLMGRRTSLSGIFLPPAVLALAAIGAVLGPRMATPLVVLSVVSLALSLGPTTPWFKLYYALPGFAIFRAPARLHYLVAFGAAVCAGFGVDAIRRHAARRRWYANLGIGSIVAAATLGYVIVSLREGPSIVPAHLDGYDAMAATATAAIGLLSPTLIGPAALLASAGGLWSARVNDAMLPYSPRAGSVACCASTYRALAERSKLSRIGGAAPATQWLLPAFMSKNAMQYRFYGLDDYDPLAPARLINYIWALTEGPRRPGDEARLGPAVLADHPFANPRLLDIAGVEFLVAPGTAFRQVADQVPTAYREVADLVAPIDRPKIRVFENPAALPRAYLAPAVRRVGNDDEALQSLVDESFDATREVVAVGAPPFSLDGDTNPAGDAASIVSYAPEEVTISTSSSGSRALVLTDAFAPGWIATVDGQETPIWRANYLFRGMWLSQGPHEVKFVYRAPGYRAGLIAAVCAVLVLVGVPIARRRGA